ncbi:MAG: sigma 54-interacting transcriptional regulator [Thermodesulfobacteriota bacterium]
MGRPPASEKGVLLSRHWVALVDHLGIGALTIDQRRRVTSFNRSLLKLMGLEEDQVLGRQCRDLFSEVPCQADCPLQTEWNGHQETLDIEILDSSRKKHLVTRLATPIFDPQGRVAGCLTLFQDHSALAELINRVNHDVRNLKIILDNLNIGIFTVNRGGLVTFFNTQAEMITGYNRRQVLGKSASIILGGEEEGDFTVLAESIAGGKPVTGRRTVITTKDGDLVTVRSDYLPLVNEQGRTVGGLAAMQDLTLANQLVQVISDRCTFHNMVGKDPAMQKVFETIRVVADSDVTVLIEGATGTGKDLVARAIHATSRYADRPLVKVNCAAIPENLLESELFGYAKGAFSGADRNKPGRFQEADGGTIFLDEIGDLPLNLQAKLLRVLDDKEFYPLGSRRTVKVNVRVLSATNRDLSRLVERGLFREDLFYRLNVIRIELPELRNRRADLPLLLRHIIRRLCAARKIEPPRISEEAMEMLLAYDYPGNVRELENILEHALIICQDQVVTLRHFQGCLKRRTVLSRPPLDRTAEPSAGDARGREETLRMLQKHNWHRERTAAALGIDRTTLWRRMKKFGLSP